MLEACADDAALARVAAEFGTPSYVYVTDRIEQRIAELKAGFGDRFALSYAAKSNPNPELLRWLSTRIDTLDISSIGEMRLGLRGGWTADRMSFTGPGKRDAELREAVEGGLGELIVESLDEAIRADRIAAEAGRVQHILVRIAPDRVPKGFGDQMAGRPSAFGIDCETIHEELPRILALRNLRLIGLHIYSGTQCLVPGAICENYRIFMQLFSEICARHDIHPEKLVFGSGLGVPYFENDTPLDLAATAGGIAAELDAFRAQPRFRKARLVLELGRYLVGEAGYFLTGVTTIKDSRGTRFAICDGGMNNHLPASGNFGMVIHRNYRMHRVGGGEPARKVNLVGPLCTPLDRIGVGVHLPELAVGDVIAVHNSGAYGLTASPLHFISHEPPREILLEGGQARDVTRALGDTAA
ncbi:type III PLP-dependent enzyme [Defluviimonas sp. WL0075]|uniref:Type III PLP-dependent enzyme n=1 Tax=Albidovulum sediminicola TaxID=2984331 RepID=A0ABT2Z5P4_9RHOB|nr:type III PLP-dependent enzyme [Defluviimonas sp. WL0075]MCV2866472.1 type III PLP-dependent enzyme [Defluviimonas sp. WL0075]